MDFRQILMTAAQSGGTAPWTPLSLGASLLAWWDAERSDLITQSGGAVSSWKDIVGGYDLAQSIGSARPTYGATSFNSRPGITPDGVDDCLELSTGLTWLPAGATPSEDWYLVDQATPAATTGTNELGSWGSTVNGNSRRTFRFGGSGANTARSTVGGVSVTNNGDFTGRHVVRQIVSATDHNVELDAVAATPGAVVSATIATRVRMFATPFAAATFFGKCITNSRLITAPLTAPQATLLYAYLNTRL